MRLPRPKPFPARLPVAAVANIGLLVALYFFVIAGQHADDAAGSPPVASSPTESGLGAACVVIARAPRGAEGPTVWRLSDGRRPSRAMADLEAVFLEASRIVDDEPDRPFLLRADAATSWGGLDEVLETLQRAGVRRIVLWTSGGSGGAP